MEKPRLEDKELLTVYEAAELFHLSRRKLIRLVNQGHLPFLVKYGNRRLVIQTELVKYLEYPGRKEELANGRSWTKKGFQA